MDAQRRVSMTRLSDVATIVAAVLVALVTITAETLAKGQPLHVESDPGSSFRKLGSLAAQRGASECLGEPYPPDSAMVGCVYYSTDRRRLERFTIELAGRTIEAPTDVLSVVEFPRRTGNSHFFYRESQRPDASWYIAFKIQSFAQRDDLAARGPGTGGLEVRVLSSGIVQYWRINAIRERVELLLEEQF